MQNIATQTAQRPVTSAGAEVLASYGAGVGGEAMPEDPLTGELIGGGIAALAPSALMMTPTVIGAKWLAGKMPTFGGKARAAKAMQADVSDPVAAAAKLAPPEFDAQGNVIQAMPSARQINEPRVLARERQLRQESSPQHAEKIEQHIQDTVKKAQREAIGIEGDPSVAKATIAEQGSSTVRRAVERAQRAAADAEDALSDLGVNDNPSTISQDARAKIRLAEEKADDAAKAAWKEVGLESPGGYNSTKEQVQSILDRVGAPLKSEVIPKFVRKELKRAQKKPVTLKDIQSLRSMIGARKRAIRGDPEKAPLEKWLIELEESLLDDMKSVEAINPKKLTDALGATNYLVNTFKKGNLGRIRGYNADKTPRVADADTLSEVVTGKNAVPNIQKLIQAVPGAEDDVKQFLRHSFAAAATKQGKFNRSAANNFIADLRKRRIFEQFPDLEKELINSTSMSNRADVMKKAAELARARGGARLQSGVNKSLASMYSDEGAGVLFDAKNPVLMAKRLKTRMRGNEAAEKGLQRDFTESLWARSQKSRPDAEGEDVVDVGVFNKLTKEHEGTMRSLGMSDEQIRNIKELGKKMQQAQAKPGPGDTPSGVFDPYGWLLNRVAAITGARQGAWLNRATGGAGAGPSLQAAQMGASAGRQASGALHIDPARKLMLEAMDNPEMMRDLLLYKQVDAKAQKQARAKLNAWLVGMGAEPLGEDDWEDSE